jgi:hypothetical protein
MTEGRLRWFLLAGVLLGALGLGALRMVTGFGVIPDPTPAPTASPSYPAAWRAYSPRDGSFRVVAPTPPKEQAASTNAGTLHRVDFPPPGDGAWFVEWLDVDPTAAAGRTDADLVDMALSTMPDRLGAQIDEEDLLKDGPFPGVELQLASSPPSSSACPDQHRGHGSDARGAWRRACPSRPSARRAREDPAAPPGHHRGRADVMAEPLSPPVARRSVSSRSCSPRSAG